MRRGLDTFRAAAWLLFALLVAPPIVWLLVGAVRAVGVFLVSALGDRVPAPQAWVMGRPYTGFLLEPHAWLLLGRSLQLALSTTVAAALVGTVLGVGIARVATTARGGLVVGALFTLALPPYVAAIAWSSALSRGGLVAVLLQTEYGARPPVSSSGLAAAAGVQASLFWPVVALLLARALQGIPASLEEAARLETTPWRAFLVAARPRASAAVGAGALLVFLLALADYAVPGTMGVTVYPVEILSRFQAERDEGRVASLALPLLLLVAPLVPLQHTLMAAAAAGDGDTADGQSTRLLPLGRWRPLAVTALWLTPLLTVVLPLAVLFRESMPPRTYVTVLAESGSAIGLTLQLAAAAAAVTTLLGLLVAEGVRLTGVRGVLFDLVATAPYALPGSLIAVAWISLLNRPGPLGDLYASVWVLPLAYVTLFFPFAFRSIADGVRSVPASLLEAARIDGASASAIAGRVVVPLVRGHLLVAATLGFVLASRELDATTLLRPPDGDTLGFRIHDLYHYGPSRQVAALAVVATVTSAILLAAAWQAFSRWGRDQG